MNPPTRGLVYAAGAFTLGVILGPAGPSVPVRLAIALLLFLVVLTLTFARDRDGWRAFSLLLLWASLGWVRAAPPPAPVTPLGTVWVEGRVRVPVETLDGRTRIRLALERWTAGTVSGRLHGGAYATLDGAPPLKAGEYVRLAGELLPIPGPRNPGDFDARAWWRMRGVRFRLTGAGHLKEFGVDGLAGRWDRWVGDARSWIAAWVRRTGDSQTVPLSLALLIGDRYGWDEPLRERLASGGLMHLFAISGLHIALLALILRTALSLTALGPRRSSIVALLGIWLIVPLTGANPPVVRAAVMLTLVVTGHALERQVRIGYTLTLAYIALLAWRPSGLYDPGFQLSFAGAAGTIYAASRFEGLMRYARSSRPVNAPRRWLRWGAGALLAFLVSLGAWIATAPLVIWHFGRLPWFGPLVTLPALPLLTLALTAGWLMVLTSPLPALAGIFGAALHTLVWALDLIAGTAASWLPVSAFLPSTMAVAALVASVSVAFFMNRMARTPVAGGMLALLSVAVVIVFAGLWLPEQRVVVAVVDVGQGDGILLKRGTHAVLIDGGRETGRSAERMLRQAGVRSLDLLLLTHGDADHAGAATHLARMMPVKAALIGPGTVRDAAGRTTVETLRKRGVPVFVGGEGTGVDLGRLGHLDVLSPVPALNASHVADNDLSLVTLWTCGSCQALFPGDASRRVEDRLAGAGKLCNVDLLLAGHHGSRYSTGERLLAAVRPELAVISCGVRNRYGHPAGEVLSRLEKRSVKVLRTDRQGAIILVPGPAGFSIVPWSGWW